MARTAMLGLACALAVSSAVLVGCGGPANPEPGSVEPAGETWTTVTPSGESQGTGGARASEESSARAGLAAHGGSDVRDSREGVVFLEGGVEVDGRWIPYGVTTAFFVGQVGEDPTYLVSSDTLLDVMEHYGSGQMLLYETGDGQEVRGKTMLRANVADDSYLQATLVERDRISGLALFKVDQSTTERKALALRQLTADDAGCNLTAICYPQMHDEGYDGSSSSRGSTDATLITGVLSKAYTRSGSGTRFLLFDASGIDASLGGPVVNDDGDVVGVYLGGSNTAEGRIVVSAEEIADLLERNRVVYTGYGSLS